MEDYMPNENEGASTPAPAAEPKYVTEEMLGTALNAAITNHMKRFAEKQLPGMFESALKPIHEKLAAPPPVVTPSTEPKPVTASPEYLAMEKKLADALARLQASDEARTAAERKRLEDRAYADLKSTLAGKVRPEFLDMLASHLFKVENRIEFEGENPVFKVRQKTSYGVFEDVALPIADGVAAYLTSDEAKHFLPAPATSGADPMPRKSASAGAPSQYDLTKRAGNGTDRERLERAMQMEAVLAKKLGI